MTKYPFGLGVGLGLFLGISLTYIRVYVRSRRGIFKIDRSNPDKDVYRLDIDGFDNLHKKKYLLLQVDSHADLSQK